MKLANQIPSLTSPLTMSVSLRSRNTVFKILFLRENQASILKQFSLICSIPTNEMSAMLLPFKR